MREHKFISLSFGGIEGDGHFGVTVPSDSRTPRYKQGTQIMNSRQLTIVSAEDLREIAARLEIPEVRPEHMGANLLIEGFPKLSSIKPSTRIKFSNSTAVLVADGENRPCKLPARELGRSYPDSRKNLKNFVESAEGLRGISTWVECPGEISVDCSLTLLPDYYG